MKIFKSAGLLENNWKLFFKVDRMALSLGWHVLTIFVCGSLHSRVRLRSKSFLYIFSTCFIVIFNSFSWITRSISSFKHGFAAQQLVCFLWTYKSQLNKLSFGHIFWNMWWMGIWGAITAQKKKFYIKDFFIFCAVYLEISDNLQV